MAGPRIGIASIQHESCGFVDREVSLESFRESELEPEAILQHGAANTVLDGVVRGVREAGAEPVPLLVYSPADAGQPTTATLQSVVDDLVAAVAAAGQLDGIAIGLHGGFSATTTDDADGTILAALRAALGPDAPLTAVHDMHANLSTLGIGAATALCIIRTYPHVDSAARGAQAAALAVAAARGEVAPSMAWRPLPLLWSAGCMIDAESPMADVKQRIEHLETLPGVLAAGVHTGYQWVDNASVGAGVVVTTDGDPAAAGSHAQELARWLWSQRQQLLRQPLRPADALQLADDVGTYPVVLADQADNTGGGAPGDSTEILRLFVERGLTDAVVLYMVDPEVANAAHAAGVDATMQVALGGKSHPLLGPPVELRVEVLAVASGEFVYDGPMARGRAATMGASAWLRHQGVSVVVVSRRHQPIDTAFCRTLGMAVAEFRYVAVKSTGHFRSGFGPLAAQIFNVDAAGLLSHDFAALPYRQLQGVYPLDPAAQPSWW